MSDTNDHDRHAHVLTPHTGSGAFITQDSATLGDQNVGNRYEIMGLLGSGGMGSVYKVRDVALDEVVALKTLNAELSQDASALGRFRREVKLARRVTHPNVARTFDIGSIDGVTYLTMEFIDGESLRGRIDRRVHATFHEVLRLIIQVCEGLQSAHDAGVVHRDLKPDNVMLDREGRAVITDFGVARAPRRRDNAHQTGVDGLIGTPQYMAPEQVEGASDLDGRADLYAVGVMLFELLSGEPPWQGETAVSVAVARLINPPPTLPDPELPGELVDLVARTMSRHRDARPASARELADALTRIVDKVGSDPAVTKLSEDTHSPPDTLEPSTQQETTLAVLPVRNRSSEDDAHLAIGIAEELAGELAMLEGLLVKPLSATSSLDLSRGPQELGRELGVRVVVDSSMRRRGDTLRVRVALVSADDGFQIWGSKFSGDVGDIFDIAEDAAEAIALALTTNYSPAARPDSLTNPIAVELYMRARRTLSHDWHESMDSTLELFDQVFALAPDDPRVLAGMATAQSRAAFFCLDDSMIPAMHERALDLARQAVSRAPEWADPHYALAIVSYNANDFTSAARHCADALALHADHLDARDLLGRILAETGPLDTAILHLTRALHLDPRLDRARMDLSRAHALSHDWDTAEAHLESLVANTFSQEIANAIHMRYAIWRGEVPSLASVDKLAQFDRSPMTLAACAPYFHTADPRGDLVEHLPQLAEELRARFNSSRFYLLELQFLVDIATWAGAFDVALDGIEDLVDLGLRDLMWLQRTPIMIRLAERPRYARCVDRLRRAVASTRSVTT